MQLHLPAYLKRNSFPVLLFTLIIFCVTPNAQAQTPEQRRQIQLKSNIKNLATLINAFTTKYQSDEAEVAQYLRLHPGVKRMFEKNRSVYYLKRISKEGLPVYINTKNRESGRMIGADQLHTGGSVGANVIGTGMIAGVWDLGQVRGTHELLSGKVAQQAGQPKNSATGNDHMTHVTGTMVGKEIAGQPSARGIAYDATAQNYDDDNDAAEMAAFAASGLLISNHSYGYANDNTTPVWQYGAYDTDSRGYDVVAKNAPFYLPFVAAGNEQTSSGNPTKAGYDIITGASAAKNVVTVGALNGDSTMSDYSNWGPTDDGRFKPEVVAKGTGINSSTYTSDNSYSGNGAGSSGTSYATPAVAAASLLLQQYYRNLTTANMRSSTLRGLLMHTAFDLGNPGPDYKFGYGLTSADKAGNLIKQAKGSATPQGSSITEVATNPANNGTDEMVINVVAKGSEPLKVSIAWTDDEGPEQTSGDGVDPTTGRLVYDFDVLVRNTTTAAETRPWRPMGMANRTANATRGSAWFEGDNNNYRQVLIESPTANTTYAIVIRKSASSPAAARAFSLIVSGMSLPGSVITDHFRSKQTGNWSDVNTWESSPDGTTWSAATLTPDFNSNTITIRNPHTVTVTANLTIDQTTVNAQSVISVNPGIVLTINDGAGTDLTVTDIAGLVLRSTAAGTASIGTSAGTISGQVVVERYNSNKRAWRLLGIPYSASTVTIRDTWMEGLSQLVLGFIPPGYGTQITTFNGDSRAANFDGQKPGSSIRIYAADNFNSDLAHTPNTTDNIASNQAYFLFVRGDRSIDRTTAGAASSATTLRTYGTPNQGNVTKGVTGTSFSLIPNPYPSQINFDAVKAIAANTSISIFYVWDATLGTVGQYRTVQVTGASPNYTYTATPGSADNNWRFIESGAAFMVPGNRTVQFTEATKSAGTPPSSMFRTAAGNETQLEVNLYTLNSGNATLADGVRGIFDNAYAAAIDNDDAKKVTGFEVNLGISNTGEVLSIEKRPMVTENDVIGLKVWNAEPGNYRLEVQPANFPSSALSAYLKDKYLDTYTPVSLTADTKVDFTITADAASSASDRFSIVFSKTSLVNNGKSAIVVYPNPVQNGMVSVRFNNQPKGFYTVKIVNTLGQAVISRRIEHAGGSNVQTINVHRIKGTYMLEVVNPDNSKQAQKVIIN